MNSRDIINVRNCPPFYYQYYMEFLRNQQFPGFYNVDRLQNFNNNSFYKGQYFQNNFQNYHQFGRSMFPSNKQLSYRNFPPMIMKDKDKISNSDKNCMVRRNQEKKMKQNRLKIKTDKVNFLIKNNLVNINSNSIKNSPMSTKVTQQENDSTQKTYNNIFCYDYSSTFKGNLVSPSNSELENKIQLNFNDHYTPSKESNLKPVEVSLNVQNSLISCLIRILSNKSIKEIIFLKLKPEERKILILFLIKKGLICQRSPFSIEKTIESEESFRLCLTKIKPVSDSNQWGLFETTLNGVLRMCFSDFLKGYKNISIRNDYLSETANKEFWKFLVKEGTNKRKEIKNDEQHFNQIYNKILRNIQVKKKRLKKKPVPGSKKLKYLNIFMRKHTVKDVMNILKYSKTFSEHYRNAKNHIKNQYDLNCTNKIISVKFGLKLRHRLNRCIESLHNWIKKRGNETFSCKKRLKQSLRYVTCPGTLQDYLKVFNMIDTRL